MSETFSSALKKPFQRYALAVGAVAASFLLRTVLVRVFSIDLPPFILFYPTVMAVAILGGLGAGLLATGLAVVITDCFVMQPVGHFAISTPSDAVALALFAGMGILMSLFSERYRQSHLYIANFKVQLAMRKNEEELRHASEFSKLALDAAGLGTWEFLPGTGKASVDETGLKLLGFEPGEAYTNGSLSERIHPDDQSIVRDAIGKSISGVAGGLWGMEYRVVWPDGTIHWLTSHGRAYFSGEGEERRATRLIGVNMDVTDRKLADDARLAERSKLDVALASMTDAVFISDIAGNPIQFNDAFATFHRLKDKPDFGMKFGDLRDLVELYTAEGEVVPVELRPVSRALHGETGTNVEYRIRHRDSGEIWDGSFSFSPLRDSGGAITGSVVVARDITESKWAEESIRRLNRVYSVLSDINQTIVRESDSQAMLEAACQIAVEKGKFRMAWIGTIDFATSELMPIASSGMVDGYLDQVKIDFSDPSTATGPAAICFHTGRPAICNDIEHELLRPWKNYALRNGYRSVAAFPLRSEGHIVAIFSLYASELAFFDDDEVKLLDEMAMDISFALEVNRHEKEREKADEELRWRTAFFEAQVDSAIDGIMVVNTKGQDPVRNPRLIEMFKIPAHVMESPDDDQRREFVESMMKNPVEDIAKFDYLNTNQEEVSRDEIELIDGTILERYSAPVIDKAKIHYGRIWTFRDITERRQLEEQFRQAQKMEAIGQLTGGIAHDFNNLLTVILGCSEVMGEEVKASPRLNKMAEMITDAAQRGADLTHRMLSFARRQSLQPKPVNINLLLKGMESFLRRALTAEIALQVIHSKDDCEATIDPTQLESALLNLCVNARDAMPEGGRLTIETRYTTLDADYAAENPEVVPGEYILIVVTDTGGGISPENLRRVFDPFFTTKEVGRGTGLGLSMVYGFVKQSKGHVKIYSETGLGTSVRLYVPKATQRSEPAKLQRLPFEDFRGSETVLLVEDNDPVRELARTQLVDLGYQVLMAANGNDAMELVRANENIDLLFTDMAMPGGMNGRELANKAIKLRSKLKVLICSGYADNAIFNEGLPGTEVIVLNKPYTRLELAKKVREALTES